VGLLQRVHDALQRGTSLVGVRKVAGMVEASMRASVSLAIRHFAYAWAILDMDVVIAC
jgi:hypothetical protein